MFLHACRALAVCAVITGFFGSVLTLIGMKCTKIGGSEIANSRVTFAGSATYLVSGKTYLKYFHIISVLDVLYSPFVMPRILWNDHLFMVGQQSDKRICRSQFQGTKVSISEAAWFILEYVCVRIWAHTCTETNLELQCLLAGEALSSSSLGGRCWATSQEKKA